MRCLTKDGAYFKKIYFRHKLFLFGRKNKQLLLSFYFQSKSEAEPFPLHLLFIHCNSFFVNHAYHNNNNTKIY